MSQTQNKSVRSREDNLKKFGKDKPSTQPDPSLKKAWRERKRQAQAMMDLILRYGTMTKKQLEKITSKKDLTLLEQLMLKYVSWWMKDNKILIDFINRHVPYAPTKTELTGEDWQDLSIKTIIINRW